MEAQPKVEKKDSQTQGAEVLGGLAWMMCMVMAMALGSNATPPEMSTNRPNNCSNIKTGSNALVVPMSGVGITVDGINNVVTLTINSAIITQSKYSGMYSFGSSVSIFQVAPVTTNQIVTQDGSLVPASGLSAYNYQPIVAMFFPLSAPDGATLYKTLLEARAAESKVQIDYYACQYFANGNAYGAPSMGYRIARISLLGT